MQDITLQRTCPSRQSNISYSVARWPGTLRWLFKLYYLNCIRCRKFRTYHYGWITTSSRRKSVIPSFLQTTSFLNPSWNRVFLHQQNHTKRPHKKPTTTCNQTTPLCHPTDSHLLFSSKHCLTMSTKFMKALMNWVPNNLTEKLNIQPGKEENFI